MAVIPDFKSSTLIVFLQYNVAPGSTVYTDSLKSFTGLSEAGNRHLPRIQPLQAELRQGAKSVVPLATEHWQPAAVAHRTYHRVSREQLRVHLDKFVFRRNR